MGEPGNAYIAHTCETLAGLGLRAEWLEPCDLAQRFPQIAIDGLGAALLEPEAGVIRAQAAVQALVDARRRRGGRRLSQDGRR